MVLEIDYHADAVTVPAHVFLVVEEVVVEIGIIPVVAGAEPDLALGHGQVEAKACAQAHQVGVGAAPVARHARAGVQVDDHVIVQGRAFSRVPDQQLGVGDEPLQLHLGFGGPQDVDEGMVGQVLANPRRVDDSLYSMLPEVFAGADAGEHENLWRRDCAGAKDDFLGLDDEGLSVGNGLDRPWPGGVRRWCRRVCAGP